MSAMIKRKLWCREPDGITTLAQGDVNAIQGPIIVLNEAGMGKTTLLEWIVCPPGYAGQRTVQLKAMKRLKATTLIGALIFGVGSQIASLPQAEAGSPSVATGCKGTSRPDLSCDAISAEAALRQTRDADSQALAAWWAVAVGSLTLLAAVAAAVFARSAALHTKAGADEAKRAADAAHDANRPWVFVKNVIWEPEADFIRILFTNAGPSPASNFIKSISGHLLPVPFPAMPIEMPDQSMSSFLPPGAIEEMTLQKPENIRDGYIYRVRIALSYQWSSGKAETHVEDYACEPDGRVRKVTPKDSANYGGYKHGMTYGEPMPIPD